MNTLRIFKFISVGTVSTVTYFIFAFVLNYIDPQSPEINSIYAYLAGMTISFTGQRVVTFQSANSIKPDILRFLVLSIIGLILSYFCLYFINTNLGLAPIFGNLLVCLLIPLVNYIIMSLWVFKAQEVVD